MTDNITTQVGTVKEVEVRYSDYLSKNPSGDDYLSIQKWNNGEGFTIFDQDNMTYSFTHAQWKAIKKGMRRLEKED